MPELSAAEVAQITGGVLSGDADARAASFSPDSRSVRPGVAFVGLAGWTTSPTGSEHVPAAIAAGAPFAIVPCDGPVGASCVRVSDMEDALARLAAVWRDALDVRVVAITGSTGKTLTKDLTAAALSSRYGVHAAPASYNNELGLPLTVLGCTDDAEVMVAELAARHGGEIGVLARLVRPEVAIITGVGFAHFGEFGSREAIARTKAEVLQSLPSAGVAVLPSGDDFLDVLASATNARVLTVGPGGAVRPKTVALSPDGRPVAEIAFPDGRSVRLQLPVPGRPLVRNAAMALAGAVCLDVDPAVAAAAIERAPTSKGRMRFVPCGTRTLVNDAYNSNPTSAMAAIRTVAEIAGDRPHWAVLAQMAELGSITDAQHARLGRIAARLGYERVVAVGPLAAAIARAAGASGTLVSNREKALELVRNAPSDAVVLVKGSLVTGLQHLAIDVQTAWAGEVA